MKRKYNLLLAASCAVLALHSQVLFQEDFTSPFAGTGWSVQNLSASANPTLAWFQGNGAATFPAYNGGPNDYVAVNYNNSSSSSPATISSWLITPSLSLINGGILEFATRTSTNPNTYADRLEVYMSTAGSGTNVGATPTSLGTFSTLLVTINPSLTSTGYPGAWTVYSVSLSGLAGPTAGRIGFRYHVTNSGPAGSNGDYIGLDAVKYSMACGVTLQSYTVCAGGSATLNAQGGSAGATYTWSPVASNSPSVIVTPSATTIYTLVYDEGGSPCPAVTSTVTIGGQLSVSVSASAYSVCAGETVTLTAQSAASTYSWSNGAQTPVTTVTVNANTVYAVGVMSGFCFGGATLQINALPTPTLSYNLTPSVICQGKTYTLNATGAASFAWFTSATASTTNNPASFTGGTSGSTTYTLWGINSSGCEAEMPVQFTVNATPTLAISSSTSQACTNSTVNITGSGAASYNWTGATTSTNAAFVFTTGATAGTSQFSLSGTSPEGCTSSAVYTQTVVVCNTGTINGIGEGAGFSETTVFPNPFSTELRVTPLDGSVTIYNSLGHVILHETIRYSGLIKTAELPKGAYVMKMHNGSGELVKTVKLLKQ